MHGVHIAGAAVTVWLSIAVPITALQSADFEGTAHGFPVLRDSAGETLADGDFSQWLENEQLHVRIRYDFGRGRRVEERAAFRQRPRLIQEAVVARVPEWEGLSRF